jgi:hypothetical protein
MENQVEQNTYNRIKFPKKFLKIALFPLSLSMTFFITQLYYSSKLKELQQVESDLKKQLESQLQVAKKLDDALAIVEGHLDTFDLSHKSLFNAVIDIEDSPQNEAFIIKPFPKIAYKGSSLFGELEHRTNFVTKKLSLQNKFLTTFLSVARCLPFQQFAQYTYLI